MGKKMGTGIWNLKNPNGLPFWWTGSTYFVDKSIQTPLKALVKPWQQPRRLGTNLGQRKQQGHKDSLFLRNHVNTVDYDMTQFLQQCVDRYVELAGPNFKFKKVETPFPDDKIARPIMGEAEARGNSSP